MTASRILLCAAEPTAVEDVKRLLEEGGHQVDFHLLNGGEPADLDGHQLVVLDGSRQPDAAQALCRLLRLRVADGFLPILYLTDDLTPAARLGSFDSGADAYLLRPFEPGELRAQVQALLRIKDMHSKLCEKTTEVQRVNRRLQQSYQRIDEELELARRVQQSFLPQVLPALPPARFAVHYRPCGRVGGDFYDVFRLDESHLGFYVADAMGHGVPASLLTIFLKKGVRPKDIFGNQYRLVPPDEVLQRLNRDLIEQGLAEKPFITMVYGLFDCRACTLQFARAGHPLPLHLTEGKDPEACQAQGPILGVFEAEFSVQSRQLRPGDKVLIYTDGIDAFSFEDKPCGKDSLLACAARHRALPIDAFLLKLSSELTAPTPQADDVTMLGLEVTDAPRP